jgi:hypothetical protein
MPKCLFIPDNHPDRDGLITFRFNSFTRDGVIPGMVRIPAGRHGVYVVRPSGSGRLYRPIKGTYIECDETTWDRHWVYPRFIPVPIFPLALGWIPSY